MAKDEDIFGEYLEPGENHIGYLRERANYIRRQKNKKKQDQQNEVGPAPEITEGMWEERESYRTNFVKLHAGLFPDSTGQKPFGKKQQASIMFGQDIFTEGGMLLKLEPRAFAKTTRITNEALMAILLGMQDYVVILCSNIAKAEEILDSLKTELYNNEQLAELFPGPMACFRHLEDVPQKARYQTYNGEKTYIQWGVKGLRFPWVPGEPCSGKHIEVRPLSNVKGLHKKIKAGPDVGKIFRPTLFLLDDPQTSDDARSEPEIARIIMQIDRDALAGGSHSRAAAAIMAITPVCYGDVAWHYEQNAIEWEIVKYKMVEKFPDDHDWWLDEYQPVLLSYDRHTRGSKMKAALKARKLLEDNYERAHKGSVVTWEHAYGWDQKIQVEISALQHAYNIIFYKGWTYFEFEYQCNTEYGHKQGDEQLNATEAQILTKVLPLEKKKVPQRASKIVTHIDVNDDFLSYVTICSPEILQPHIIDYGTYPDQRGIYSKRNIRIPLKSIYPQINDYREILYHAVRDLVEFIAQKQYTREDGVMVNNDAIGIDIRYEEVYVGRAIRESPFRNIIVPCRGVGVGPDDELLHEKPPAGALSTYENCFIKPNKNGTLDVLNLDTNFFKTEVHRGFNLPIGVKGSLTMFGRETDSQLVHPHRHKVISDHCNSEEPERKKGIKKHSLDVTRVVWSEKGSQIDNEYFDNLVNDLALLTKLGVTLQIDPTPQEKKAEEHENMNAFIQSQKNRNILA